MILEQWFDDATFTYTYLIGDPDSGKAALIDPVREQVERDLAALEAHGLTLAYVLETHVHADHVTGAGELRARTGAETVSSLRGAPCASLHVAHGDVLRLGEIALRVLETPGHTDDSLSFAVDGHVFTGDALFIGGTGRTDFQNGDASALYRSLTEVLFALPDETLVWPGHDYNGRQHSTIGHERRTNPRIAGASLSEFVARMAALDLAPPARIHEAVPMNRACGRDQ